MRKISTVLMTTIIALFLSGSTLAKTSREIYFGDGLAKANAPFYIPIEKLIPDIHYTVYCDMINESNEVISFSLVGNIDARYYSPIYVNDKRFGTQAHLPRGKSKLKVDWIIFSNHHPYPNRYMKVINADQTNPIFLKNCYATPMN